MKGTNILTNVSSFYKKPKEPTFTPEWGSKWAKYKTHWCFSVKNKCICQNGDLCFYAHSQEELREYDEPIKCSAREKIEKAERLEKVDIANYIQRSEDLLKVADIKLK